MLVAEPETFCGCDVMGPWTYFGELVGERLVAYILLLSSLRSAIAVF